MKRSLCLIVLPLSVIALLVVPAATQEESAPLFKSKCAPCHAADGSSKTEAGAKMQIPDLRSAAVQKLTDEELFESIALGKGHKNYPHTFSYKGLSDAQIHGLVRYLRELAHKSASHPANTNH